MRGYKMFKLCFLIFLSLALSNLSEARQEKKHSSAVLIGSVFCDTCFQQSFSKASHFISGADVAVECSGTNTTPKFKKVVSTNEHGEFKVHLPFSVSKHVKKIKRCSVKLIKSSEPFCSVASTATSSALHLKSRKEGKHIFSAGFFTFKPLNQPELCDQKPSVQESKEFESRKSSITNPNDPRYLPPLGNPPTPTSNPPPLVRGLPLLPALPLLPPLPALGISFLPPGPQRESTTKGTTKESEVSNQKVAQPQFFGPNPFRPPSLFPPIIPSPPTSTLPPTLPSPPTSIFPPIIPTPSTSPPSLLPPGNFPPAVPGLFPSPLPPSPPLFQFPFQPLPGFPGAPPAAKSTSSRNRSP